MAAEDLPESLIQSFRFYYNQIQEGATGYIHRDQALPVAQLPRAAEMTAYAASGVAALDRLVVLKLNGGLGTSMGMNGPKSLLPVKNDLTFLDITARQILALRATYSARIPLLLMNSFSTRAESLAALAAYPSLVHGLPLDFVQHKVPKIRQDNLLPVVWPDDPDKEWCPPGHGDIYLALQTSGMLAALLERGYKYAFISNVDNLGAVVDTDILGYMAEEKLPFLMEVTARTSGDRKGGHLAQTAEGRLLLREIAQCPPEELEEFQDIQRFSYFNTNNLWLHLPSLHAVLQEHNGVLPLPLIRNGKPVDPSLPDSPPVYQLETAMGLAISIFAGSRAISVPRNRFRPVKKCNDLLALWSDAYVLTDNFRVRLDPCRHSGAAPAGDPLVTLDDSYYTLIDDMKARFPHGAPSLLQCSSLTVCGDVYFGAGVVVQGNASVCNRSGGPLWIADGTVLRGEMECSALTGPQVDESTPTQIA
ncbi:MAG: UTP--glucose-1-phosphate uridylyltransferase [Chloroflexi bacterium]|nr:MAG: UTP--glucose-1-phosphate uridylyltransferase [Chloroflexota bacterium]